MSLSRTDTVASGDLFVLHSAENDDFRGAPANVVAAYIQSLLSLADNKVTQYAAPASTGFTVALTDNSASKWLLLTPTGTLAAGTITLPAQANCVDKQEILVNSTQTVTALTVAGNGSTVNGGPTTIAANGFFRLRFDGVFKAWYRVG
jgi:hypothetical protein